jgi:hypothetical protein
VTAAQRGRVAVARVVLVGGRVVAEVMLGWRRVGDGALADVGGEGLQGGAACGAGTGAGLGA